LSPILKLAYRYFSKYRIRSFSMIISIALSIFLTVVIGSLSLSVRNANVIDCKNLDGPQHVIYRDRNFNLHNFKKLKANPQVKNWAALFYYGAWVAPNGYTVNLLAADRTILYMNNTRMQAGRYPIHSGEIALEAWALQRLHLSRQLGQNIPVRLLNGTETTDYRLVGIIQDQMQTMSTGQLEAFIGFNRQNLQERATENNALNLLVEFRDQTNLNQTIKQTAAELGLKISDDTVLLNRDLLTALGQMDAVDWYLVSVALMLMLVGGMVIYSIYSISVLKRVQDYGMLRAIGSTPRQIIGIMLAEVAIIYAAGALLGIVGGGLFVQLFKGATTSMFIPAAIEADNFQLGIIMVSPFAIKLSLLIALGSLLAAITRGAWLALRVSPIAAINRVTQDDNINLASNRLEKLLSIPQRISFKNLKRNKKALFFIIIAMSAGCTLYMVESFKGVLFDHSAGNYLTVSSFWSDDFGLNVNGTTPMARGYSQAQVEELRHMSAVKHVKAMQVLYSRLKLRPDELNGLYGERYVKYMNRLEANYSGDQRTTFQARNRQRFALFDRGELVMRNTVIGLSSHDLTNLEKIMLHHTHRATRQSDLPRAILYIPRVNPQGTFKEIEGVKAQPVLNIREGDYITLTFPIQGYRRMGDNVALINDYQANKGDYADQEFVVTGVIHTLSETDQTLIGTHYGPYLYVAEHDLQRMTGFKNYRIIGIQLKHPERTADYRLVKARVDYLADLLPGTFVSDKVQFKKEVEEGHRQYMLLIGAIATILILIGGLSIYTNIYYDLISRQREFGIMRAIGLTKPQLNRMLHFEGLLYGAIAALASCIIAFIIEYAIMAYYLHLGEDPYMTGRFFIEWKSTLLVIVVNLTIGYIAALSPARQVNKTPINEAIRSVE